MQADGHTNAQNFLPSNPSRFRSLPKTPYLIFINNYTMASNDQNSRRNFIKNLGFAGAAFTIVPRHVIGKGYTAPSDTLYIGGIGVGGSHAGFTHPVPRPACHACRSLGN